MSAERNRALFLEFVNSMNSGDLPGMLKVWSPRMVHHGRGGDYHRDDVAKLMGTFRTAFPDLAFEVENVVADGDMVAARMTATCTHTGALDGLPATGRRVRVQVMGQVRIADGQIVEHWNVMDELHFLNQLGLVPDELVRTILA